MKGRLIRLTVCAAIVLCITSSVIAQDSAKDVTTSTGSVVRADIASQIDELLREFQSRGLAIDSNACTSAALQAIIHAALPDAEIVSWPWSTDSLAATNGCRTGVATPEELGGGIGYIHLSSLDEAEASVATEKVLEWDGVGATGAILDLRGSSGCSPESISHLAGLFVMSDSVIFKIFDSDGQELTSVSVVSRQERLSIPVVLLVDSDTGGACELLVSILKGRGGVLVIGSQTKGDDRVVERITMDSGIVIRARTRFAVPVAGKQYGNTGITPDVTIDETSYIEHGRLALLEKEGRKRSSKEQEYVELQRRAGSDTVLGRAIDVILAAGVVSVHE